MKSTITIDADRYIELLHCEAQLKALLATVNRLLPHEDARPVDGAAHLDLYCHGLRRQRQKLRRDLLSVVCVVEAMQ